jgi:hypothetical protein
MKRAANLLSAIYFILCMLVFTVGIISVSRVVNLPAENDITVANKLSQPIVMPSLDFNINKAQPEELLNFQTNILKAGQTFFLYREQCTDVPLTVELHVVRYLETTLSTGETITIPVGSSSMVVTPGKHCMDVIVPYVLPKTLPCGEYVLKAYAMYENYFGLVKLLTIEDINFTVDNSMENKS